MSEPSMIDALLLGAAFYYAYNRFIVPQTPPADHEAVPVYRKVITEEGNEFFKFDMNTVLLLTILFIISLTIKELGKEFERRGI